MNKVIIVGKIPPPYMGTSIWYEILRNSGLNEIFEIHWFNVNIHNDVSTFGKKSVRNVLKNIRLYLRFIHLLNTFKPDLVLVPISQSTIGFIKDSVFIRLTRKKAKTVIMLHGSNLRNWLGASSGLVNFYFSRTMKNVTAAIVLGEKLKYIFKPWFDEKKIFVVHNGIDLNFQNTGSNQIDQDTRIRYIGSLMPSKGISGLIETAVILKQKGRIFRLLLNGRWRTTEYERSCTTLINRNAIPVFYEGEVTGDMKSSAYRNTDIFIFTPNKPEGHPMVIIEAMAFGLPVITCDQGAITESVIDGVNGFIVNAGDPADIAEKIIFLMDNPDTRRKMGIESRRLYEENFTEEKMIDRLRQVLTKIIEDN